LLASKNRVTDLASSEKQTLFRFATLFILLSIIIIEGFSFMYYSSQKELMLQEKKSTLESYAKGFLQDLKRLHINFDKTQLYPRNKNYESAIFDSAERMIFASSPTKLRVDKILYLQEGYVTLVTLAESYYLGAKYVVVKIKDDEFWFRKTRKELIIFNILAFAFMFVIGTVLLRLFLKPMRDALVLLDRFIKDTTHELNTPVSTIVTNIEMIDRSQLDAKLIKKINRIDIGAKTISNIYQDLTYLTLGNKIVTKDEKLDVAVVIEERLEYFKSLADAKRVTLHKKLTATPTLFIDKAKFSKLLDNLLSNAIKYNKQNGSITVTLNTNSLEVTDTGIGIAKEHIGKMQERYSRFNNSSGGFGLGLNIVSSIAEEYKLTIQIDSEEKKWTKVSVSWLK